MDNFEKVEKLKERANVTYEEAKQALEACDWDILEAMIYLEKLGKTSGTAKAGYSAEQESTGSSGAQAGDTKEGQESFGEVMGRFGRW